MRRTTPGRIYDYVITGSSSVSQGPYLQYTPINTDPSSHIRALPPVPLPEVDHETHE